MVIRRSFSTRPASGKLQANFCERLLAFLEIFGFRQHNVGVVNIHDDGVPDFPGGIAHGLHC